LRGGFDVYIDRFYKLDWRDVSPVCIRNREFFPRNERSLEACTTDVVDYVRSMKTNIEQGSSAIREEATRAADDAVRKFNCYARREMLCY